MFTVDLEVDSGGSLIDSKICSIGWFVQARAPTPTDDGAEKWIRRFLIYDGCWSSTFLRPSRRSQTGGLEKRPQLPVLLEVRGEPGFGDPDALLDPLLARGHSWGVSSVFQTYDNVARLPPPPDEG